MLEQVRALEADDAGVVRANAPPQPPRILVIDDDHLHCMIICRTATKAGFAPVGVGSYEEAAEACAGDCIRLHHTRSVARRARRYRDAAPSWVLGCKAPIIIVSGCDDSTCRETVHIGTSLNPNILDPVPKPVDLEMLRYSLERLKAQIGRAAA
jgi:hypothetical protein